MQTNRPTAITKTLSRNDTGETGAHQAGILVPKDSSVLSFFPTLDASEFNPRRHISFLDPMGTKWVFAYIYYNNALFGGTRNEYRLTRMTPFTKAHNLRAGDTLTLSRDAEGRFRVAYARRTEVTDGERLKLGTTWRIVHI